VPSELQFTTLEIMLDPNDPSREAQRALILKVADDSDERDWRSRAPPSTADGSSSTPPPMPAAPRQEDPNAPKMQRATDIGRTAWQAGAAPIEGADQTLRKVKGILNKLTPEKFERLLAQLIPMVRSLEVLQGTIRQVFENAVQQPTFVAMYADLCSVMDAALPEFTPAGEGAKPVTFKKLLANTCQEEYEATEEARARAAAVPLAERPDAERTAKQRLLGNIRLIAELFKKDMVNSRIMLLIMADLLGNDASEESVEAVCELLTTAGASLEANSHSKPRLDAAFTQLAKLAASKSLPPRVRFVIRDLIDLRSQHWVARRETFTAKKLDDIRSEAQAELGIVDMPIPGLEPLSGPTAVLTPKRPQEVDLFPAFRGAEPLAGGRPASGGSAFLGEYVPVLAAEPVAVATPPEAPGEAPKWVGFFLSLFICSPFLPVRKVVLVSFRSRIASQLFLLPPPGLLARWRMGVYKQRI
jgi:translation initiation factor 4G